MISASEALIRSRKALIPEESKKFKDFCMDEIQRMVLSRIECGKFQCDYSISSKDRVNYAQIAADITDTLLSAGYAVTEVVGSDIFTWAISWWPRRAKVDEQSIRGAQRVRANPSLGTNPVKVDLDEYLFPTYMQKVISKQVSTGRDFTLIHSTQNHDVYCGFVTNISVPEGHSLQEVIADFEERTRYKLFNVLQGHSVMITL